MYPLLFEPFLRTMVWGGEKIAPFKGITTNIPKIGESWEISGYREHQTPVANGKYAGMLLNDLVALKKGELVGEKVYREYGDEFPLLIKFIDARADLSIQVHPDDALARELHGENARGKTEMWYVVGADPGAYLLSGLARPMTPETYVEHIENHTITDVLARHEIAPGDVFFLPAGRIHAIGAGSFIAEIQQTSDLTYRIYDYGRLGLDGMPRQLHTDKARRAIDYKVYPSYKTDYTPVKNGETSLVSCPFFTTSLFALDDADAVTRKDLRTLDSFVTLICVEGAGTLTDHEPEGDFSLSLRRGQSVLIPATSNGITFACEPIPAASSLKVLASWIA